MLLELRNVSKSYGSQQVLEPTSLGVADGEFITVLGPSGSGKTTILRIIGGFTQPTSGEVRFADEDITGVPTHRRPFNTVFQDYALFPHMTVAENVAYGLRIRGAARSVRAKTAAENLDLVGLAKFADRYPAQLSGGQKQRVALARALVCRPKLLLLDEPLAALDAELRKQMQLFLKQLQRQVRTTFLFVTHDQEEAMSISDRIVVMNVGKIEQIGAPKEIYHAPKTAFVASFFGDNNLIPGHVARRGEIVLPFGTVPTAEDFAVDTDVTVAIRPEALRLNGAPVANRLRFACRVEDISFAGALTQMVLRPEAAPEQKLMIKLAGDELRDSPASGSRVEVSLPHDGLISLRRH